ncbi:amidohydrolase [Lysinibacillus composti]|uniref:Amidohydrolase n=1 Tax=Lysinibacillus composti TaxID=720633 RepID=A0A3N9UJY3_9BACI|nr:amidohydrolase [Lysinibacillus composti]MBM7610653.1 amidohydrolase [Lysinibacillus composti]RQW71516.1 amidohydrolase [Lysinibacillus composti]
MGQVETYEGVIYGWFDHFHAYPEVSWKEFETTKKIASILDELNIKYYTFPDVTGLVAEIGTGDEVIAVRADIDALWQEVDGKMRANHSCGHDANISMVLGALIQLKDLPLQKRIRFIFQPAEETGGGAIAMVKHGVVDDVSYLFGVHLRPIEELPFGKVTPAIHHGAALFLQGSIHGIDAHGARPHQGKNAIDVVFAIQQMLQNLHINPFEVYSAKLTKIVADGGSVNIIPGNATFSIDVRAQKNSVLAELQARLDEGFKSIKNMFNTDIKWQWMDRTPGADVSKEATEIATSAIIEALGDQSLEKPISTPGSDDFHYYTVLRPNLKATMIGIGADLEPGLHHPNMTFNKEALIIGANVLTATLRKAAQK